VTASPAPDSGAAASIRRSLRRWTLAAEVERAALATGLDLCATDVIAIEHLIEQGRLSPTQLGERLRLSSGASTALVQRLERAGCVVREAHPVDGRSVLVRLSQAIGERLGETKAPLTERIDDLTAELSVAERETVARFMETVADLSERCARDLARDIRDDRARAAEIVTPGPWA
jgi:MarR family multiple antibiotic resistance transcriptional regulator